MENDSEEINDETSLSCESLSPHRKPGMKAFKPFCPCCITKCRKGYTLGKAASRYYSEKARRSKPKSKDHR